MKAVILKRDKIIKIRYNEGESINDLLEKLMSVPGNGGKKQVNELLKNRNWR